MKKLLSSVYLAFALATPSLLFMPPLAAILVTTQGCKAGTGQYNPSTHVYDANANADTVVVTAEKTGATALDAFARFMEYERTNEIALAKVSPKIHAAAEEIRAHGRTWLLDLDAAKVAYQANRGDPGNVTKINAVIATIQSALTSALLYLATHLTK
jgi:hypothetical protein